MHSLVNAPASDDKYQRRLTKTKARQQISKPGNKYKIQATRNINAGQQIPKRGNKNQSQATI